MQNANREVVDLYIPRKCSATNQLIHATDNSSVQIRIGHVDENGLYNLDTTTFAFCGELRARGESDDHLTRLATEAGLINEVPHSTSL